MLLRANAALNASLGIDSTKTEIDGIRKQIRGNIRMIKDLCPHTHSIIDIDDNHKTVNQ